ncbi:hypothetical protein Pmani_020553 [Petrolisthes manimaculis]|uniref:Fucosyltransferase n=1 Tax=Petrolisthes manimaculis TaxID=1843537 RepID=A0AAE1PID6_9EUCA|nr:hypothetical protein Pmani_020553 [Petrolisthes manimaculis]
MVGISRFRSLRLQVLLLLTICTLGIINLLFSNPNTPGRSGELERVEEWKVEQQKHVRRVGFARSSNSAPVFKKELSFGVREEENSAREVLDLEGGGEKERHGGGVDPDAANEVNSIEPDTNAMKKARLMAIDKDEEEEEDESNYHKIPPPPPPPLPEEEEEEEMDKTKNKHVNIINNWRNLTDKEISKLSNLGRRLFLNQSIGEIQPRNFTILVWKSGPSVERRLLKEYGNVRKDPFRKCSAHNCRLTYEDKEATTADAILIHLHRTKGPDTFPNRTKLNQRWIWLTDESPYNTFMVSKIKKLDAYNGYFNWSMSYKMDSDIPVPYGRTVALTPGEISSYQPKDYYSLKSKTIAIMGSNCGGKNKRWKYVKELQKYIDVDTYGGCGKLKCPGHYTQDCSAISDYKFYLSFENSDCDEYITEKLWWHALGKGPVPIVMGGNITSYHKHLPPNSFIHANSINTPKDLAKYLRYLLKHPDEYNQYHAWRSSYKVLNEHGYFQSEVFHYCRICEALNYNDPTPKTYTALQTYWNKDTLCHPSTWDTRI